VHKGTSRNLNASPEELVPVRKNAGNPNSRGLGKSYLGDPGGQRQGEENRGPFFTLKGGEDVGGKERRGGGASNGSGRGF